jgi:hypothetical protein
MMICQLLPSACLIEIFLFLGVDDLETVMATSKDFRSLAFQVEDQVFRQWTAQRDLVKMTTRFRKVYTSPWR